MSIYFYLECPNVYKLKLLHSIIIVVLIQNLHEVPNPTIRPFNIELHMDTACVGFGFGRGVRGRRSF